MRVKFAIAVLFALLLGGLMLSPVGKPDDEVRSLSLSSRFGAQRQGFSSRSNQRGLPHLPRSVTITAAEGHFSAWILDLSAITDPVERVRVAQSATTAIEAGRVPDPTGLIWSTANASRAAATLHRWPWGISDYLLIVYSAEPAEVQVRISFGA